MSSSNPIYQIFPGKALADFAPAASAIGLAEQTARDLLWRGNFPVKTVKIGRKRLVVVADLARYYAELVGLPTATTDTPADAPASIAPRKRGRPSNAEKARQAAGSATVGSEVRPGAEGMSSLARVADELKNGSAA